MQIDVAAEAPAPALYPPAPALEVAAARERAKYQEMQRSLRQEVAMWKKRSQRLSRGSCVVINELALLIEGGGDEPDLHEHSWGSEKEVAKSGPWKLDPIKNSVYKTHPRKEEAIRLYQDWSIRVIPSFNQPLNNWNVSKVTNMRWMFEQTSFNQSLNNWNVSKAVSYTHLTLPTKA